MSNKVSSKTTPMTARAAARIQSAEAIRSGGQVKTGTFAARAQHAANVTQPPTKRSK
jgi:hypothetical protein